MAKQSTSVLGSPDGVQVGIITTSGRVVTDEILKQYKVDGSESKQIDDKKWKSPIIEPPHDLAKLLQWNDVNVIHSSCIRVKCLDSVGIGFHLEPEDDNTDDNEDVTLDEEDTNYKKLMTFFSKVNEKESLTMMLKKVFHDYESCGNGYIEVARGPDDKIIGLYHINATTMRWCSDKKKLIQRVGEKYVYFKLFGNEEILNRTTGNFVKAVTKPEDVANEVIPIVQYSWRSSCYGLPEWLPAIYPMFGDMKETEYNLDFFINFGVPAYAILIEGAALTDEVQQEIKKYFETTLKNSNHKTLNLSVPKGGKITFQPLSVDQKEASFRIYRKDNRLDILASHRVPPYRVGVVEQGQLGGNVADATDLIYLESVINPRQEDFMWVINELIIKAGFEINTWKLEFNDINVANKKVDSEIYNSYIANGVMSPNEVRAKLGLDPYSGGDAMYVSSLLLPAGLSPDAEDVETQTEVSCSNCGATFDWAAEPESKMGWVKCPQCGWLVDQTGKAVETDAEAQPKQAQDIGAKGATKPKVIPDKEAKEAKKVYSRSRK